MPISNNFSPEAAAGGELTPSVLLKLVALGKELPRSAIDRIEDDLAEMGRRLHALETERLLKTGGATLPAALAANDLQVLQEALTAARQVAATVAVDSLGRSVVSSLDDYLFASNSQEI
ncbi:MAG: hypothetical protein Q7U75_17410 [Desulfobacterales bacterium]|nr:hypothetical protein [Desulfobacterales bacterium]